MDVLILGGTGVISTGIAHHLVHRGANVTLYNRGRRRGAPASGLARIVGDRANRREFEHTFEASRYDVVIDMICFTKEDADSTVRAFGGRCEQLQFCSTVCTYGVKIPPNVLIDERFPQEPTTPYAESKWDCERRLERAAAEGLFQLTVVRPSHTYGPGGTLIDQLELDGGAWDRVARGQPVFCAGDGLGLWQSTHRDDCGRFFAYAAGNPRTYGEAYNATQETVVTWRDYYRLAAAALDTKAALIFAPAHWLLRELPHRFAFLQEVTQFHGAYSSAKARAHVPEFRMSIDLQTGAREVFADLRRRGAWRDSTGDLEYQRLVDKALGAGFGVEPA